MKSGFVAIFGKPNVGKSTMMNNLLHKKISIVSPKAQTTRSAIKGIYNDDDSQIVFIDTPGIQKDPNKMGQFMNRLAYQALQEVDAIILVLDVSRFLYEKDEEVLRVRGNAICPLIIVLNKIDLIRADQMAIIKEKCQTLYEGALIIEMSALNKFNLDTLLNTLKSVLPDGPLYYERDQLSDAPIMFLAGEMVREKVMYIYDKEIPYSTLVLCERLVNKENRIEVDVVIAIERESQKGIIIGKNGDKLRKLNFQAKKEMHKLFNKQIDLSLFVKVIKDWKEKESFLKLIHY